MVGLSRTSVYVIDVKSKQGLKLVLTKNRYYFRQLKSEVKADEERIDHIDVDGIVDLIGGRGRF